MEIKALSQLWLVGELRVVLLSEELWEFGLRAKLQNSVVL